MPTLSIEILCVGAKSVTLPGVDFIGLDTTCPPRSDRAPSIWQSHMDKIGGVLVHLFDPSTKYRQHRWAYDIIDEIDWEEFKFKPKVFTELKGILECLIGQSECGELYFYSDAQWSNDPLMCDISQSLSSFLTQLESQPIRMNTAFLITKG